jgi:quercetin dioxygenase-like cupin family protein
MRRVAQLGFLAGLGVLALVVNAGTTLATPPAGFGAPFTYRATMQPYRVSSHDFKIVQKKPEDVVMRELTISPGGNSGWHTHPGPVFVLVTQGSVVNYHAKERTCKGTKIVAGQGFVETPGDTHMVRNEDPSTTAVLFVTFLDVPVGGAFRIDEPKPGNCPF